MIIERENDWRTRATLATIEAWKRLPDDAVPTMVSTVVISQSMQDFDFEQADDKGRTIGCRATIRLTSYPDSGMAPAWIINVRATRDRKNYGASHSGYACSTSAEADAQVDKLVSASFLRYRKAITAKLG